MKTTLFLLSFMLFTLSACGQQQDFERLSDKEVRKNAIHIGEQFINEFHAALEEGAAYQFNADNATSEIRQLFTPEMQIATFEQIKINLENMSMHHTLKHGCSDQIPTIPYSVTRLSFLIVRPR